MPDITGAWRPESADPSQTAWYAEKWTGSRTIARAPPSAAAHRPAATPSDGVTITGRSAIQRHAAASMARNGPCGIAATASALARYGGGGERGHRAQPGTRDTPRRGPPPAAGGARPAPAPPRAG